MLARPPFPVPDALFPTDSVSGANATEFSDTSPRSRTRMGLLARRTALVSMSVQNSIVSTPLRSEPDPPRDVRRERHRRPEGVPPIRQRNTFVVGSRWPPTDSG